MTATIIAIVIYIMGVIFCFVLFFLSYGPGVSLLEALKWPLLASYIIKANIEDWYKETFK